MRPIWLSLVVTALCLNLSLATADDKPAIIRVGIIGLDTSHSIAFTKILNNENAPADVANCRVVAAYPYGSRNIPSSTNRIPQYTEDIQKLGVEIVPSIEALLERVDAVLLETNDGHPHLEQALPVFQAGKRIYIDKPIAASLADAVAIFEASKKYDVPTFSSSSLRYGKTTQAARAGEYGKIVACETTSPSSIEASHPDLFWYGIHGCESLFTVMGTGCQTVKRGERDGRIEVVGTWEGGRTGVFREDKGYGGTATNEKGETFPVGGSDGYRPLVVDIVKYFRTGEVAIDPAETLELYAFMEAADESKRQGGAEVRLASVMEKAKAEAASRLKALGVNE